MVVKRRKKVFLKLLSKTQTIKTFSVALALVLALLNLEVAFAEPSEVVEISAPRAVLMEEKTGKILYEKNPDEKCEIASVTKIMTLLLTAEAIDGGEISLGDEVTCSAEASSMGGSQIWLKEGEKMTVEQLLKAVCISSANDASYALAEHIKGSHKAFVSAMNKKAKELGMENTNFKNCTGLDEEDHYSSARDVAIMSRELLKHDLILNYSTIWMDDLRGGETQLVNTNRLLKTYKGAVGLKTGTTDKAGKCLSAVARRDGLSLIAVSLGDKESKARFQSAKELLDFGFSEYFFYEPKSIDDELSPVKVSLGTEKELTIYAKYPLGFVLPLNEKQNISQRVFIDEEITAPIAKGQSVGKCEVVCGEKVIGEYPICASRDIEKITVGKAFIKLLSSL